MTGAGASINELLVVVEDVRDAATSSSGAPSTPLSPNATPFFPTGTPGRSKAMRWAEEFDIAVYDTDTDDGPELDCTSSAQSTYLEVVRRAVEVTPSLVATAPCEGTCSASRPVVFTKKRRRRRCQARTIGPPAAPLKPADRVPTRLRLDLHPVARVPVHQRLGQCLQASPPDGRHRRFMSNARQPSTHAGLPQHHVPRAATHVDADGFTLVQSRRRGRHHAQTHPRR